MTARPGLSNDASRRLTLSGSSRLRVVASRVRRTIRRVLRRATQRWRRSIQVRVVSSTLVVSAIVVALLGFVVLQQVKEGLIQAKLRSSVAEEALGVTQRTNVAVERDRHP